MFCAIIMLDMCSFSTNQNRELPCLQTGKGLSERDSSQKADGIKVLEIRALLH
jgi:hypothetical protein